MKTRRTAKLLLMLLTGMTLFAACTGKPNNSFSGTAARADMAGMMQRHMAPTPAEYASLRNPVAADAESRARGQAIYQANCVACHGEKGWGDGPAAATLDPPPAPIAYTADMLSDAYLFYRISEGGNRAPFNSAMPAFQQALDEQARWDLVNYMRSLDGGMMNGGMMNEMMNWMMGGGMMMGGMLLGLLVFISLGIALVLGVVWIVRRTNAPTPSKESPMEILKRRYAQGEINPEQYEAMKRQLNES